MQLTTDRIREFLAEHGALHDCRISNIALDLKQSRLEVSILDLNANFAGLPEYPGPRPARIVFYDIRAFRSDAVPEGGSLWVNETAFSVDGDLQVIEFMLCPAGKVTIHATAIEVLECGTRPSEQSTAKAPLS